MDQPGEINRKFEKSKYSNQIFYTHNIFLYFRISYISKTNLWNKKFNFFYYMDQPDAVNNKIQKSSYSKFSIFLIFFFKFHGLTRHSQ